MHVTPELARPAVPGLNFVHDEQDAMFAAAFLQPLHE